MKKFALLLTSCCLGACALLGFKNYQRYDNRSIAILTANLFDQRLSPEESERTWRGDWLFRRERLELIDQSLRRSRPDLLIFQDMLAKRGSISDSDRNILSQGALQGYDWSGFKAREYDDTQEISQHGVAASLPLRIDRAYQSSTAPLGRNGFVSYTLLDLEGEPILVANVQMPSDSVQIDSWYEVLLTLTSSQLEEVAACSQRLIIAGYLPGNASWPAYQDLLNSLELKDSSLGFCELAGECVTADTNNELYLLTADADAGSRVDRILVHRSSLVLSSQRSMMETLDASRYANRYQLLKLWPTRRFAWMTTLRMARCND
ncbi:MAG: hypothetical protein ACOH5I_15975 [Oligoflexus sp.]